ncbi:MAG: DUF3656 domain-containing protein [Syntrophomonadaceae bacterium]|nr:DUF3656 domain-containing protein [Syntrophomonadaceae bacterium]
MELLAPAGDFESFLAAIHNGADAVYVGGQSFSARQSAKNFDDDALKRAVEYAHLHKRKVLVTVNTLIDEREFGPCLDYLFKLQEMGADAVIVQDSGLIQAITRELPGLHLHGSTQMSAHGADDLQFWQRRGIERMVVARECSQEELALMRERCPQMELEVFVHGALCFSYSGQCLFSSLVGGRSGNRGRCAQPCRLAYTLWRDGRPVDLPGRYLLSPADLCLMERLPVLKELGVAALKIEGRMKRPEYVAAVTAAYRQAIDSIDAGGEFPAAARESLNEVFNRGFTAAHFAPGTGAVLSIMRPNHRGVLVGRAISQRPDGETAVKLSRELNAGDGLTAWVKSGRSPGATAVNIKRDGAVVDTAWAGETVSLWFDGRVGAGDRVFRTYNQPLMTRAQESFSGDIKLPVDAQAVLRAGQPLELIFSDREGHTARAHSDLPVEVAKQQALSEPVLREKLQRLGQTPFELKALRVDMEGELMLPFSELNEVRRQAAELLKQQILTERKPRPRMKADDAVECDIPALPDCAAPELRVSWGDAAGVAALLEAGADKVYLHLNGLGSRAPARRELKEIIAQGWGVRVIPLLPSLHEDSCTRPYREAAELFTQVMVGRWGDIEWAKAAMEQVNADYTLNTFNRLALRRLLGEGVYNVCLSPELNIKQLEGLKDYAPACEVMVHGPLTLMRSRGCVLRDTLEAGQRPCRRPCRGGDYALRDEKGYNFPLRFDADCHCYLLNSRHLNLIAELPELWAMGYRRYRLEGAGCSADELCAVLRVYRRAVDALSAKQAYPAEALTKELAKLHPEGYTKGHCFRGVI